MTKKELHDLFEKANEVMDHCKVISSFGNVSSDGQYETLEIVIKYARVITPGEA